jgi:hypothetical protein
MNSKACIDCGAMYEPRGTRQQRCDHCAVEHDRKKNLEYQPAFRARHRTKEDAERIERRTWQMDAAKSRFETLFADGMSATAIARKTGHSHHSVLRHLARPEAQWRVGILRRTDMPELPC